MLKFHGEFLPDGSWIRIKEEDKDKKNEEASSLEKSKIWPLDKPLKLPRKLSKTHVKFPRDWNLLPSSLLKRLFQFFRLEVLNNIISKVCSNWQREAILTAKQRISKSLTFTGPKQVDVLYICRELRKNGNYLESLDLYKIPEALIVLQQISRSNSELKQLTIRYCGSDCPSSFNDNIMNLFNIRPITAKSILNVIKFCKNLKRIDFKGTQFPIYKMVRELRHLESLEAVNLSGNRNISGPDILRIASNCPRIKDLRMTNLDTRKGLNDDEACLLLQIIRPRIETLRLDCINFSRNAFEMLSKCMYLEDLGLYNAQTLQGDAFILIGKNLRFLKSFKVDRAYLLKNEDFELFFRWRSSLDTFCPIERFCIPSCHQIDNIGLLYMTLFSTTNLKHLNIRDCQKMTEDAIKQVFTICPNLEKLNVAFIKADMKSIFKSIESPCKLKHLVVSNADFDESSFPGVKVQVAAWSFTSLKATNTHPFPFFKK